MHTEPPKIIMCRIEKCAYAVHLWNCGTKQWESPFY